MSCEFKSYLPNDLDNTHVQSSQMLWCHSKLYPILATSRDIRRMIFMCQGAESIKTIWLEFHEKFLYAVTRVQGLEIYIPEN